MTEEPLFETETEGLFARAQAGRGSDVLAVVFSQVRVPAGRFGLSRLFARTSHACLFLNQPENRWYRGAEAAIDAAVDRAAAATGARRIVYYGSSMGAFGALAAAARRPDAEAVVFAPDFAVGEPGSRSAEAGIAPVPGETDLGSFLATPRTGRIDLAIGLFDPYDAGVAARVAALRAPAAVRLVTLASSHEVHDHLYSVNVIRRVIAGFSRDLAVEAASKDLLTTVGDFAPYAALEALARELASGGSPDPAGVRALGLSGNPGAAFLEADAYLRRGERDAAERVLAALDAAVRADPALASLPKRYLKEIPRRRIGLLQGLGRTSEVQAVAMQAAADFPTDEGFAAVALPFPDDGAP